MESYYALPEGSTSLIEQFNTISKQKDLLHKDLAPLRKEDKENPRIPELELQAKGLNEILASLTEQFSSWIKTYLEEYINSEITTPIEFPAHLDGKWRKIVHDECDLQGLGHESKGGKSNRRLIVSRKDQPLKKRKGDDFEDCPDPVLKVKYVSLNGNKLRIEAIKPEENGSPIKSYNFYLYDVESFQFKKEMTSKDNFFTLQNLKPSTLYVFQVSAQNKNGESDRNTTFKFNTPERFKGSIYIFGNNSNESIHHDIFECKPVENPDIAVFVDSFIAPNNRTKGKCIMMGIEKTSLAVLNDGKVIQWGLTLGELSLQDNDKEEPDTVIPILSDPFYPFSDENNMDDVIIRSVHVGTNFSIATDIQGRVYSWGYNDNGQLGLGDFNPRILPTLVKFYSDKGDIIDILMKDVAVGSRHVISLNEHGRVYVWGKKQAIFGNKETDRFGQIVSYENQGINQLKPRQVTEVLNYYRGSKIAAGDCFNMVITEEGFLYSWGDNQSGQLGIGLVDEKIIQNTTVPRRIDSFGKDYAVQNISCGKEHCIASVEKRNSDIKEVFTWGSSRVGQCGHGDLENKMVPTRMTFFDGKRIKEVKAGFKYSMVLCEKEDKEIEGYVFGKICGNKKLTFNSPKKLEFGKVDAKNIQSVKTERENILLLVE